MDDSLKAELKRMFDEYQKSKADPVRIALLGQPGSGKSSLINSITGQEDLAQVGVNTDCTVEAKDYEWNEIKLVDLPGYGTENFPRLGFLERFDILKFDALLCVASSKFRDEDCEFFREVAVRHRKQCLFVRTNLDGLRQRGKSEAELRGGVIDDLARQLGDGKFRIFFVDNISGRGISDLVGAIGDMLPTSRRDKFYRWAHGTSDDFLEQKRQACNKLICWYAAGSAVNALNPIPGAGVAVDLGVVAALQMQLLKAFGFTEDMLRDYLSRFDVLKTFIAPMLNMLGKEGATLLLARFAGKELAKWIPFVGPAISATSGAALVWWAGSDMADKCLDLAKRVRDAEIDAALGGNRIAH